VTPSSRYGLFASTFLDSRGSEQNYVCVVCDEYDDNKAKTSLRIDKLVHSKSGQNSHPIGSQALFFVCFCVDRFVLNSGDVFFSRE
jgi:hypothetical protein